MILFTLALILAFVISVFSYVENFKSKPEKSRSIWSVIILCIFLLLINCFAWNDRYESFKKEKYSRDFGQFNFPISTTSPPTLSLGNLHAGEYLLGDDKWSAWSKDGRVNMQAVIRDRERNRVFYIDGIDWKNLDGKEFNYDKNGMEVKDSKGDIIFQMEFNREKNNITAYGFIYQDADRVILAGRDNTKMFAGSLPPDSDVNWLVGSLKPMFKYPRETHFGERVAN